MRKYLVYLALFVVCLPAFLSMIQPGIQKIQDDMQYFRVYEMGRCFEDGQIPCRWVPDMGYGYGYPLYIYYSPGPYYVGAILHLLGWQLIDVVKLLFILGFVLSTYGMYWLILELTGKGLSAFLGSIFYLYVPVRAVQVYVRGSLGEFLAMLFFPLIFLYSYRLINKYRLSDGLMMSLSIAGLLLTHNLMSIAFFPVLLIWILVISLINRKSWVKVMVFGLVGVGLASFYVIPLIFEREFVHLESMIGGYFDYRQHFVSLYQLFLSNKWGFGSSVLGSDDDLSLSLGYVQWIVVLVVSLLSLVTIRRKVTNNKIIIIVLGLTSLVYIFLIHEKSSFIWSYLSFMAMFQFPWRFLVVVAFLTSVVSSIGISEFFDGNKNVLLFCLGVMTIFINYNFFKPSVWYRVDDMEMLNSKNFLKQQTASIFDYLPKSSVLPPNQPAKDVPEVLDGKVLISKYEKGSNFQKGSLNVESEMATIRLPILDFPNMKVIDNGKIIPHVNDDCRGQDHCFGLITIGLQNGPHNIIVRLTDTWPRVLGNGVSFICAMIFSGLLIFKLRRNENN